MKDLQQAIRERRSYYALTNQSPVSDQRVKELIDYALLHVPSAFNSQSARIVLLLGEHHIRLWEIVKRELLERIGQERFEKSRAKIESSLQSGYGTVLFFEDQGKVREFQEEYQSYRDIFPVWSEHTSAMHQYAVWMMLESVGLGASLQHYNPLIDQAVTAEWNIDPQWRLIAQMPFGLPASAPSQKEFEPLETRRLFFE